MISQKQIREAISNGIGYLKNEQDDKGAFESLSSFNKKFSSHSVRHSVFNISLVALAIADNPEAAPILDKASRYLLSQRSHDWSYNYWERGSEEYCTDKYPDDLDDTACAMAALYKINSLSVNGEALAKVVSTLTLLEEKEGGPYRTWLVPEDSPRAWQDIDLAVNSNVAYFLSLLDVRLPNIDKVVDNAISQNKIASPYYASDIAVIYFISRFYRGRRQKDLVEILKSRIKGSDPNHMELALSVTALLNLGGRPEEQVIADNVVALLDHVSKNGWRPFPLIIEKVVSKKICYAGSPALTCALVLEALFRHIKALDSGNDSVKQSNEKLYRTIVIQAKKQFPDTNLSLKKAFVEIVDKVASKEIVLFPQFFASGLRKRDAPSSFMTKLSLANLYGWIAYSIYDDFLDQEGDPPSLAVANICLRRLDEIFQTILPEDSGFYPLAKKLLDQIDSANYWETTCCRTSSRDKIRKKELPRFESLEMLAEKSIGHSLGPLAILYRLGFSENSSETKAFIKFVKSYLIARQLNDDAHDWEDDLKRGHITFPVAQVVKDSKETELRIKTDSDFLRLRAIFWNSSILKICQEIIDHTITARECLDQISIVSNKTALLELIAPLEASAHEALDQRKRTLEFLGETDKISVPRENE